MMGGVRGVVASRRDQNRCQSPRTGIGILLVQSPIIPFQNSPISNVPQGEVPMSNLKTETRINGPAQSR